MMSAHFGHSEQFALIDVDESSGQVTRKELLASPGHQPGFLPGWLAQQGVKVVIAGGMGPRAVELFQANGVEVVLGAMESDPEKAVLSKISGALAIGDNTCDSGSEGHSCNH
jgi:predicted Fe-Mo cluster-binding NifX family protein